jgi:hypothetical protein
VYEAVIGVTLQDAKMLTNGIKLIERDGVLSTTTLEVVSEADARRRAVERTAGVA